MRILMTGASGGIGTRLRKLLPPTGVAAEFEDETLRVGTIRLPSARMVCLFNWDDHPQTIAVRLPGRSTVIDYWSDESLGPRDGSLSIQMAPHSARLFALR